MVLRPESFALCYHLDRAWRCGLDHAANFEEGIRMRKTIGILLLGMLSLLAPRDGSGLATQTEKKDALPDPAVKVGDMAPDFTLMDTHRNQVSLHDFRGKKNVALAFYIFAFTGG